MRKLFAAFASLALAVSVAVPALAETLTNDAAQVTIEVPKNWKVKKDGEAVTMTDKTEDIAVAVLVVDSGDLKGAVERLDKKLSKTISNLKWDDKGKKVELNGMKGIVLDGSGKMDGKKVDLSVLLLDTPSKSKDLVILAVGDDDDIDEHADELKFIFKNIKPAN
jgi:hypothetical protein